MRATDASCVNIERGEHWDGTPVIYTATDTDIPVVVRRHTGRVCLSARLDYDTRDLYEFNVTATDQGDLHLTFTINALL